MQPFEIILHIRRQIAKMWQAVMYYGHNVRSDGIIKVGERRWSFLQAAHKSIITAIRVSEHSFFPLPPSLSLLPLRGLAPRTKALGLVGNRDWLSAADWGVRLVWFYLDDTGLQNQWRMTGRRSQLLLYKNGVSLCCCCWWYFPPLISI